MVRGFMVIGLAVLLILPGTAPAADVVGYSILKAHFLNQTGPDELVLDPDFAFALLASVDLAEFDLLTESALELPDGTVMELEDYGDYWAILDVYPTLALLNDAYPWGDYTLSFNSVNDGNFACPLGLPETPLPPAARLINFADVQAVNSGRPLTLTWEFEAEPRPDDFVQVYVNLGHANLFSTPDLGEPGALDGTARSITIPAGTLAAGFIHGLNLEITRVTSTNADCYPHSAGASAVLRSTELDLITLFPPVLRLLSPPANNVIPVEVVADPDQTVILQFSPDLIAWSNIDTNSASSGTNLFQVPLTGQQGFIRASLP